MSSARFLLSASVSALVSLTPAFAQSYYSDFVTKTSTTANIPRNIYSVDVNNDGVPDLVQDTGSLPNTFNVSIAKGDGTFLAPVTYSLPAQYQGSIPMASGDFNGDGIADLVFELAGSNQLAVYLGKGNGTFAAPSFVTIALPAGNAFGGASLVTADFSGDGKLDLVTEANSNITGALYLMEGDGKGGFAAPRNIYTPSASQSIYEFGSVGDFNGDTHADLAFTLGSNCYPGGCATAVHVLYGNGAAGFTDGGASPYSSTGVFSFSAGDVNSDGSTDIFGVDAASSSLVVLYGQTNKTFTKQAQSTQLSSILSYGAGNLALGDFNGDGLMDIVGLNVSDPNATYINYYYGTPNSTFVEQAYGTAAGAETGVVVGDFNHDTQPDVVYVGGNAQGVQSIVDVLDESPSGYFGGCAYPVKGQGISLCSPSATPGSPVQFTASANSYGLLRKMELWVDGTKFNEQHHTFEGKAYFNYAGTFSSGSHKAVLYAVDIDNRLQDIAFTFTAGGACAKPSAPGVNVCSPVNGSTDPATVQLIASADITGTAQSMEVWVDGVKKYLQTKTTSINAPITLAAGSHRFDFYAINTAGQKWLKTVYATTK